MTDNKKAVVDGIVPIHGRDYQTVALRIKQMRADHGEQWAIDTQLLQADDETVRFKCVIRDRDRIISTGHAEEKKAASKINASSMLENCETSAIGRALASAGYLGVDVATADEMQSHREDEIVLYFIRYLDKIREHWHMLDTFKVKADEADNVNQLQTATDALQRMIGKEDFRILWRAPTKGSVFTTEERDWAGATKPQGDSETVDHAKME